MQIHHLQLLEGAKKAKGLAVVIDVFRAASHVVTLLARGAEKVVPVETVQEAWDLKQADPGRILAGEREGLPPKGFDLGNSPFEAEQAEVAGKTVILTTSAGTRGLLAASRSAEGVLFGCFLNARAVVNYIMSHRHDVVSFVPLGVCGEVPSPEDGFAAQYMELGLTGSWADPRSMFEEIRRHPEGRKFLDPENRNYRAEDLEACLQVNKYDVVPVMNRGVLMRG